MKYILTILLFMCAGPALANDSLTEDQLLTQKVAVLFVTCNKCHEEKASVWDLTKMPYEPKDPVRRAKKIKLLSDIMDLQNDGLNSEMPPVLDKVPLTAEETALVKAWVLRGAPDYDGIPQVEVSPLTPN